MSGVLGRTMHLNTGISTISLHPRQHRKSTIVLPMASRCITLPVHLLLLYIMAPRDHSCQWTPQIGVETATPAETIEVVGRGAGAGAEREAVESSLILGTQCKLPFLSRFVPPLPLISRLGADLRPCKATDNDCDSDNDSKGGAFVGPDKRQIVGIRGACPLDSTL